MHSGFCCSVILPQKDSEVMSLNGWLVLVLGMSCSRLGSTIQYIDRTQKGCVSAVQKVHLYFIAYIVFLLFSCLGAN